MVTRANTLFTRWKGRKTETNERERHKGWGRITGRRTDTVKVGIDNGRGREPKKPPPQKTKDMRGPKWLIPSASESERKGKIGTERKSSPERRPTSPEKRRRARRTKKPIRTSHPTGITGERRINKNTRKGLLVQEDKGEIVRSTGKKSKNQKLIKLYSQR